MTKVKANPSLNNILSESSLKNLYGRMALKLLDAVEHCFSVSEEKFLRGRLFRGDLQVLQSDWITERIQVAQETGNMSVKDFSSLYQLQAFFKKMPEPGDDVKCRQAGFEKLLRGEEGCRVTNKELSARISEHYPLFDRVKRIIEEILGPCVPNNFLTHGNLEVFFGPGSTVNANSRSYAETSTFYKITDRLIVPEKAKYYLAALVSSHPNWVDMLAAHYHTQQNPDESRLDFEMRVFKRHFEIVPNDYPSRIGFVPKNSEEHRAIGIEMNGLVPLQKVVGDLIRQRLKKRANIDLNSQERNKHMARQAQKFRLATIDLANASSSISYELVRALLPLEWFCLLDAFRSERGHEPKSDTIVSYEMISSMGNGFTFELESLIFYALAKATCEGVGCNGIEIKRSIAVYGDDIIVPQKAASLLYDNLALFGFTANVDKSFTKGFFFESCGGDYYDGTDVRPFYLKREISTVTDVCFLMNSLLYKIFRFEAYWLLPLYRFLFRTLAHTAPLGPLHFDTTNSYGRFVMDDLEACVRVPLDFAQANGGVSFDTKLFAWRFLQVTRLGVKSPLAGSPQYAVKHAKYMVMLKENRASKYEFLKDNTSAGGGTDVLLRGETRFTRTTGTTSHWDGVLSLKEMKLVRFLFETLTF